MPVVKGNLKDNGGGSSRVRAPGLESPAKHDDMDDGNNIESDLHPIEELAKAQLPAPPALQPLTPAATTPCPIAAGLAQCMAIMSGLATQVAANKNDTDADIARLDAQLDTTNLQVAALGEAHNDLEQNQATLGAGIDRLSREHQDVFAELAAMRTRLGLQESAVPAALIVHNDEFDRTPDLTLIKCNSVDTITKLAFIEATAGWLSKLGLDNTDDKYWSISGKDEDKYFNIRFKGATNIAAVHVANATRYLRQDGRYIDINADMPNGNKSRIYINLDKSPRQARVETLTRNLGRLLIEEYPDRISWSRKDALIYIDHMPLAQVDIVSADTPPLIRWDHTVIGTANAGACLKTEAGRRDITDKLAASTKSRRVETSHFRI